MDIRQGKSLIIAKPAEMYIYDRDLPSFCYTIMPSGILIILVIPAILAFIFGAWVVYVMVNDVSEREQSSSSFVERTGPDTIRMRVPTGQ